MLKMTHKPNVSNVLNPEGSTSEPDLITAGRRSYKAGFPPGFIVDDLRWHRKKKPPGNWQLLDNLKPDEGSMKKFKTEYKRCYKKYNFLHSSNEELSDENEDGLAELRTSIKPTNFLKLEGDVPLHPEYKGYPAQRPTNVLHLPRGSLQLEGLVNISSESKEKYINYETIPRTRISRRSSSNLQTGEFMAKSSEMHSQFVQHEGAHRPEPARRPTSLRLDGEVASTTETAEKYVGYLNGEQTVQNKRAVATRPASSLKLEGGMNTSTETTDQYVPFNLPQRATLSKRPTNLRLLSNDNIMDSHSEKQDKFVPFNVQEKSALIKRDTNLHLEGEQFTSTENKDQYVPLNITTRPPLQKRHTNLHLEGAMDIQTEKQEKYVPYELSTRQKFTKRPTNLHMEGSMETTTEQHDKYIPFEVQKRPALLKKDTNLHLEGELIMTPEYRQQFVEYNAERSIPKRPINNLGPIHKQGQEKIKDNFFLEYQKPYRNPEPKFRYHYIYNRDEKAHFKKPKENLKPEGSLELLSESRSKYTQPLVEHKSAEDLTILESPRELIQQGDISFPERRKRARGVHPAGNLKAAEGQMESNPEYRSSYVDFPRERPIVRRPEGSLRPEGHVLHVSEKEAQFIEHSYAPRPPLAKRDTELKMEGKFECQPEYRKAYVDYLQREDLSRKPRPFDNVILENVKYVNGIAEPLHPSSKIPLPKDKLKSARKPPKSERSAPPSGKSRSISPDRRRKTPLAPRTPLQQRVLVPDISVTTPRRPSSIFGPKTARWYPHNIDGIPTPRPPPNFSGTDGAEHNEACRSGSRWESSCGRSDSGCGRRGDSYERRGDSYERRGDSFERRGESFDSSGTGGEQRRGDVGPRRSESYERRGDSFERRETSRRRDDCGRDYISFSEKCSPRLPSPSPPRRMWPREQQPKKPDEKAASFVVLTDKVEINNNRLTDCGGGGGEPRRTNTGCGKEQKWMPPWYEPPM